MLRATQNLFNLVWGAALLLAAAPLYGQIAPGAPISGQPVGGNLVPSQLVTDIFIGRDVVGPYALSWNGIDPSALMVWRDGFRLTTGLDYTLDAGKGILTFSAPLRTSQIARVDYLCEAGKSTQNTATPSIPIEFKLLQGGRGALSLNAIYQPPDAGSGAAGDAGSLLVGLGGQTTFATGSVGSTFTSKLYLDSRGGDLRSRGAFQLAESTKTTFGKFGVTLTRGGSAFSAGKETGIAAGRQDLEATGALNPVFGITASASFRQTVELPASGSGATVDVLGERLAGVLFGQLRFQATHTDTTTHAGDGTISLRTADRIQLDQSLGKRTQATALVERNQNEYSDGSMVAQTNTLLIRNRPTDSVTLTGTYKNQLLPSGAQDTTSVRMDAEATKQLKLGAVVTDQLAPTSATHSREATLEFTPSSRYTLGGSLGVTASGSTQSLAGGISATARPDRFVELTGSVRLRNDYSNGVADPTTPDTYSLNLALNVFNKALRVTGGFADNPEDAKGLISRTYNRNLGLQSTLGQFDLAGTYTLRSDYLSPSTSTIMDLKLGWRFTRASSLVTSFRQALVQDSSLSAADTYSLSLTHRIGSIFDLALSGVMTTYEKDGIAQPNSDYRAEAKLGVRF